VGDLSDEEMEVEVEKLAEDLRLVGAVRSATLSRMAPPAARTGAVLSARWR
jgi:hypothetical protein